MSKTNDLTLLAFDFGMKKIGVAVGQTVTQSGTPLDTIFAKNGVPDWSLIATLIKTWQPTELVVGIPLNMDGTSQPITVKAKRFIETLRDRFHLPVHEVDERLTTVEAKQQLFDSGGFKALKTISIDSFAAKLIIEAWMRSHDKDKNE